MLHPLGKIKTTWDLVLTMFVFWSWIFIPFDIAFNIEDWGILNSQVINIQWFSSGYISLTVVDYLIDILFMIDIFVNFRTVLINSRTGEEWHDIETIACTYILKGRFAIDFIAWIPFELISLLFKTNKMYAKLFKLLKLSRLLRISKIIAYLRTKRSIKHSLGILKTTLFWLLWIHWIVWLWYTTISINKTWLPPKDTSTHETVIYSASYFSRYLVIYEYAAQITNAVDFLPTNKVEVLCCIAIYFLGRVILGVIIVKLKIN